MTSAATSKSRSLNVRTSAVHSRCNRNRQPRASDAHPYTAVCTRRCRLITRFESQTSFTFPLVLHQPMRTVRLQPARKWQQLATAVPSDAGGSVHNTAPRRSTDSRVHSSPKPNHCCAHSPRVSPHQLVNLRAHSFAQLPQHLTGTSNSGCTRTASSWLHTMPRNSTRECHNCSVVL